MKALIKLEFRTVISSGKLVMFAVMPTVLLLLYGALGLDLAQALSTVLVITMISVGMMNFGVEVAELKKTVVFKRIGSTQMTKTQVVGAFAISWTMFLLIVYAWTALFAAFLVGVGYYEFSQAAMQAINWGGVIYGLAIGILLSLILGWFMAVTTKSVMQYYAVAALYFMAAIFLGGIFFPGLEAQWITIIGYFIPHTYILTFLTDAFAGANVFNLSGYEVIVVSMDWYSVTVPVDPVNGYDQLVMDEFVADAFNAEYITYSGVEVLSTDPEGYNVVNYTDLTAWRTVSATTARLNILIPLILAAFFGALGIKNFQWDAK